MFALGLLSGCDALPPAGAVQQVTAQPTIEPTPTPDVRSRSYAVYPGIIATVAPVVKPATVAQHVGERVAVQGRVKWCQSQDGTHVYALNTEGTVRFAIGPGDRSAFSLVQLLAYCSATRVQGVVRQEASLYVIPVKSPDQVTL